ncbi:hypothetical protein QFC19_008638 [Naganishia cerealis]|uniref:Uncharacterized protein n=1 Tax=Naganishia cerealis TaxID=610337 RepID=A0ACC2V0U9_9TREE|nr:hypothetical protein QFC19_008638 [Naganishia cerealis]
MTRTSRLTQALECPICKSPFNAPVSVPCGHSFCSRCIRDALAERKECPVCREAVKEAGIRRNRVVEEIQGAWEEVNADFLRFLDAGHSRPSTKRKAPDPPGGVSKRRCVNGQDATSQSNFLRGQAPTRENLGKNVQTIVLDDDDDNEDGEVNPGVETLGVSSRTNSRDDMDATDQLEENEVYALPPSGQTQPNSVPCPACGRSVPFSTLNAHLDRSCRSPPVPPPPGTTTTKAIWAKLFSGAAGDDSSSATSHSPAVDLTRKISKPNYHLATPKELRALLETYGCSTVGERATLIERVQLWISIFK